MKEKKSRQEINLSRLLKRCQEIANNSADLSSEWRLPTFVSSCEEMMETLPKPPDPAAPSPESLLEYRNGLQVLRKLLPKSQAEDLQAPSLGRPPPASPCLPLPQGSSSCRDTVSRQLIQRETHRHEQGRREQLLGPEQHGERALEPGTNLDELLSSHRDQQERVAEEMIALTRSLKEQSSAAGNFLRQDTARLNDTAAMADTNLAKLTEETQRVGEFSARGSCRCWIWLMMLIVVLTFMGMVLTMRLFRKRPVALPDPVYQSVAPPVTEAGPGPGRPKLEL